MNSLEIAKFTEYFNIAAICLTAVFAVLGVLALVSKKFGLKVFRAGIFTIAFGIASIIAFVAEITVFNFQHYLKYFSGPELHTIGMSPENPNIILTSDSIRAITRTENKGDSSTFKIFFKDINRKITSVFANVSFESGEVTEMHLRWTDEESVREYKKTLYKYRPHDNYALLQSCGKVSELLITFCSSQSSASVDIISVSINKPIPFYFSGLRLLVISLLFFVFITLLQKTLRAKASYYLFEYRFDPNNKKQNLVYAVAVVLLILFSLACVYSYRVVDTFITVGEQYNKYLVDALIDGRTWLDYGNPEKLFSVERLYDYHWLLLNNYELNVDFMVDWAWHNGKYYSYFGIVPAVILYLPYKLITGNYLSHSAGVSLFVSATIILMALFWRFCVKRYMPDTRFVFYLLSFLALFFVAGMWALLSFPTVYTVVQMAGLMFSLAGILLLLKSVESGERVNCLKLFFACLCLALVVGCRPNLIFVSLIVPVVLWKYRSWKLLLFVMIPYIMVAIPLCIYNYIRFESITDFGTGHHVAIMNTVAYQYINPIGKAIRIFVCGMQYLFLPFRYSLYFPFVDYIPQHPFIDSVTLGSYLLSENCGGIINFPIVLCLFYLFKMISFKDKPTMFHILSAFLIIAVLQIITVSSMIGLNGRYFADFAFFIILPSLFCAFYWCNDKDSVHQPKTRMKVTYVLLGISVLIGLSLFAVGLGSWLGNSSLDPVLYRYLEYSLGILRKV